MIGTTLLLNAALGQMFSGTFDGNWCKAKKAQVLNVTTAERWGKLFRLVIDLEKFGLLHLFTKIDLYFSTLYSSVSWEQTYVFISITVFALRVRVFTSPKMCNYCKVKGHER
jgi:hypothetical protein